MEQERLIYVYMSHMSLPDRQATEKIFRKIMSTGRDTGRFSDKAGRSSVPMRSSPNRKSHPSSRKSEVGGKSTPGATLLQVGTVSHETVTHK